MVSKHAPVPPAAARRVGKRDVLPRGRPAENCGSFDIPSALRMWNDLTC